MKINIAKKLIKLANELLYDQIQLKNNNDFYEFFLNSKQIGHCDINIDFFDNIINEYVDTVDDIDDSIFNELKINMNEKIINIEYFYLNKEFRNQHLAKPCMKKLLKELSNKGSGIILRAYPDKDTDINNLINFYSSLGFKTIQKTNEGNIMFLKL